jgi:uncharacterized protein YkwD
VAIVGLATVVCTAGGGAPASDAAPSIERMEADLVRRVNAARRERALTALKTDRALASAARAYSCRMAAERFLGHEAPDGSTLADRIRATGKPYRLLGENLAMNVNAADPVAAAVTGWMKSESHRENILRAEFTETGVGICRRDTRHYFTQLFLRP